MTFIAHQPSSRAISTARMQLIGPAALAGGLNQRFLGPAAMKDAMWVARTTQASTPKKPCAHAGSIGSHRWRT